MIRRFFILEHSREFSTPERGTVDVILPPLFMDGRRPIEGKAPPNLGEHTDEVLRAAGIAEPQMKTLRSKGVIS